jgi:hypothetical protein
VRVLAFRIEKRGRYVRRQEVVEPHKDLPPK